MSNDDGNAIKALLQSGQVSATFLPQELPTVPGAAQGDLACFVREATDYCVSIYRSAAPKASPEWVFVYKASISTLYKSFMDRPSFQGSYFRTDITPHERGIVTAGSTRAQQIASWGSMWTFDNTVFAESNAGGGIWTPDLTADDIFAELSLNSPQGLQATSSYRIPVSYVGPADPVNPWNPTDYWQDGFNCVNASSPWMVCPSGMQANSDGTACVCSAGYGGPSGGPCTGNGCVCLYTCVCEHLRNV